MNKNARFMFENEVAPEIREAGYQIQNQLDRRMHNTTCAYLIKSPNSHVSQKYLVQARHFDDERNYRVGFMHEAFQKVQRVLIWFGGEDFFIDFPVEFLREVLEIANQKRIARYVSKGSQWVVHFPLRSTEHPNMIKLAGSEERISFRDYIVKKAVC